MIYCGRRSWRCVALVLGLLLLASVGYAQPHIAYVQPDQATPGMTLALEILAPVTATGSFGADGFAPGTISIVFSDPTDSTRATFGIPVVSWNGRLIQVPLFVYPTAFAGVLKFNVKVGKFISNVDSIEILRSAQDLPTLAGDVALGEAIGNVSQRNTIIVKNLKIGSLTDLSRLTLSRIDPDSSKPGNNRLLPLTIISQGPIELTNTILNFSADSMNGAPGGGGGGHGYAGFGGVGFTGGGSDSVGSVTNVGSGSDPIDTTGGGAFTGVLGGYSDVSDQGGGGGTGSPFGSSGKAGANGTTSPAGGFGGGSAGGESAIPDSVYGGGGGGFGTDGSAGQGIGNNAGHANGGRLLLPLQGGSGGGAGNSREDSPNAGSGGGGGGAIALISFDSIIFTNSSIAAAGGNGTYGSARTGGGGGGAGGGIVLSSQVGARINGSSFRAAGGNGGVGGLHGGNGGAGGLGRLRFDGVSIDGCTTCSTTGLLTSGPVLSRQDSLFINPFGVIHGLAQDTTVLSDSIRIYYRTLRTPWRFTDTVRFLSNGKYVYRKTLPLTHDALVLVSVYQKVKTPQRTAFNAEPDWMLTHVSNAFVYHRPSPHLVVTTDTIDVGCTKRGNCISVKVRIDDLSDTLARIDSVHSSNPEFSAPNAQGLLIGSYSYDSIEVQYCPLDVGKDTATLLIYSRDSVRKLVVTGCGSSRDERLVISPSPLDFGRIVVGRCDTLQLALRSIGEDSIHITSVELPSDFHLIHSIDTILAPQDSLQALVQFCPSDSGTRVGKITFSSTSVLTLHGTGLRRILQADSILDLHTICSGACIDTLLQVKNRGNDTLQVLGVQELSLTILDTGAVTIAPDSVRSLHIRFCDDLTNTPQEIHLKSNAENEDSVRILFERISIDVAGYLTKSQLGACIDGQDSATAVIRNLSGVAIHLDSIYFLHGDRFRLHTPSSSQINSHDSLLTEFYFDAKDLTAYTDTIVIHLHSLSCDSTITLAVSAQGSSSPLGYLHSLDFGNVALGDCKSDTIQINNYCGPDVTLNIQRQGSSTFSVTPSSLTLATGQAGAIIIQYCPTTADLDSSIILLTPTDTLYVKGRGVLDGTSQAKLSILSVEAILDSAVTVPIRLDSIASEFSVDTLNFQLRYDPNILRYVRTDPSTALTSAHWKTVVTRQDGMIYYQLSRGDRSIASGQLLNTQWIALLGDADTTTLQIDSVHVSPERSLAVIDGTVTIASCGPIAGKVKPAGVFTIQAPLPNPASTFVKVHVKLGAEGDIAFAVLDAIGKTLRVYKYPSMAAGEHAILLDLTALPDGACFLTVDCDGWHDSKPLLIQH